MRRLVVPVLAAFVLAGCGGRGAEVAGSQPALTGSQPALTGSQPVPTGSQPSGATSEVQVTPKLSPHGKDVLAQARRAGATSVVLIISTQPAATESTAANLRQLGATVEASDATIGYVRVSVPVELAEKAASAEGIQHVDVDEPLSYVDPTP